MRSLHSASALLASLGDPAQLPTLLTELGFTTPALTLDALAQERLALPPTVITAAVARGPGNLRALVLTLTPDAQAKDTLSRIATRLANRVPHLLWLLVVTQYDSPLIALAAWRNAHPLPRVSALVTYHDRIVDSDAETLCALAAIDTRSAGPAEDLLRHARWLDILGREAITRRFYKALESAIHTLAQSLTPAPPQADAATIALLYASRLLFLSFLETKGWLNNDFGFLINGFADSMALGGRYQQRVLEPLFFGTLNTRPTQRAKRAHAFGKIPFLNGGLFTRTPLERRFRHSTFSDEALGALYEHVLGKYRFTAREDASTWSEAAVDPEMLGRAFESLMATTERKRSGAYFTPQPLVEHITTTTLTQALQNSTIPPDVVVRALAGDSVPADIAGKLLDRTSTLRILDPACGSGAFLVHALESIATLRTNLGDPIPTAAIRRNVLTRSIHGVDINPTAVWLCELRLWLSVVIESHERDPMRVLPLPNLDHQIRVGDSLAGGTFTNPLDHNTAQSISTLRERYARANGPRKRTLAKRLDHAERARALHNLDRTITRTQHERRTLVDLARTRDLFAQRTGTNDTTTRRLKELRTTLLRLRNQYRAIREGAALPFAFSTHYANVSANLGFDMIIGNPPWVRLHHVPRNTRATLRETFTSFRNAAWHTGATAARAGTGFASQTDLATLFVERSIDLLAPSGVLGLLVPSKLWHSLAGGGIRTLLQQKTTITQLEDLTESTPTFEAVVYPSVLIANRTDHPIRDALCTTIVHRRNTKTRWTTPFHTLHFDDSPGTPWLTIPPDVRTAFDAITQSGTPLTLTPLGRPHLGVKCGCNAAFIVHEQQQQQPPHAQRAHTELFTQDDALVAVTTAKHATQIERTILRPLIRGEAIHPWSITHSTERIIWTHDTTGAPLQTLPHHTHAWLNHWRTRLRNRSDVRHRHRWWALFRTEAADTEFPRVVWSDLGQSPRAAILFPSDPAIPLNSCYIARTPTIDDALTLTTLINSPLAAAWLTILAEPARGTYRRFLGWTMALLPTPQDWPHARTLLAPLGKRAIEGSPPSPDELLTATLTAYRLDYATVAPLLAWTSK